MWKADTNTAKLESLGVDRIDCLASVSSFDTCNLADLEPSHLPESDLACRLSEALSASVGDRHFNAPSEYLSCAVLSHLAVI